MTRYLLTFCVTGNDFKSGESLLSFANIRLTDVYFVLSFLRCYHCFYVFLKIF